MNDQAIPLTTALEIRAEVRRLRAENAILTKSNDHYADMSNWDCGNDLCSDYTECGNGPTVYRPNGNGYDIALQAKYEIATLREAQKK